MAELPEMPPGAVALSDLMPHGRARRVGLLNGVRWLLVLAYGITLLVLLPHQIAKYKGSVFGLTVNIFFSLACSGIILFGMASVLKGSVRRLKDGVRSWLEGTTLVVSGVGAGRCDLASAEVSIGRQSSDAATVSPVHQRVPILVLGPDAEGRQLRYLLGEPLTGGLRPPSDLLTLAQVLRKSPIQSARTAAQQLSELAGHRSQPGHQTG